MSLDSMTPQIATPKPRKKRPILKWSVLVCLSAVCSFIAAILTEHKSPGDIAAMLLGIITYIFIYIYFERWVIGRGHEAFARALTISVITKIVLEVLPAVELGSGAVANLAADAVGLPEHGFLCSYFLTVVVGLQLSIVVVLLTFPIMYIRVLLQRRAARKGSVQPLRTRANETV